MVSTRSRINRICMLAAGAVGLGAALSAAAADSITVPVTANVVGVCKFNSASTMNIANSGANIDPNEAGPATGTSNVVYRCSNGTTPTFTIGGAAVTGRTVALSDGGSGGMTATLSAGSVSPGSGMGAGQTKTFVITGTIVKAAGSGGYEDAPVGAYTGSFLLDVNP